MRIGFETLREKKLYAKFKCEFWPDHVAFLRYIVTKDDISVDLAKVEAIINWERTSSVIEVRSFLGLVGYYRCFVKGFSSIAAPLTNLTTKSRLVSTPILTVPSDGGGFVIYSDAFRKGLGCVLRQNDKVVAYASR